jgi:hypothetical protein
MVHLERFDFMVHLEAKQCHGFYEFQMYANAGVCCVHLPL